MVSALIVLIVVLLIIVAWRLFRRSARLVDQVELLNWVQALLKVKADGGLLTIHGEASNALVRLRRANGLGDACDVVLEIPRTRASERILDTLRQEFERQGRASIDPPIKISNLFEICVHISNIWDAAAGADAVASTKRILRCFGHDEHAPVFVELGGRNSLRMWKETAADWQRHDRPVVRRIGKGIADRVLRESGEVDQHDDRGV